MADDNKIQFDVELNEGSVESSFKKVDERAVKSAKESAAVFGEAFQRQEQELKASIDRIVGDTSKVAQKSAKESAAAFEQYFKKQDELYKASVKTSNEAFKDALKKLSGSEELNKSAKDSAAVFEAAFEKGLLQDDRSLWEKLIPQGRGSVTDLAAGFFLLQQAANAAGAAINGAINFVIQGEREIKLDKKFEVLAAQAGIAADVIKGQLKTATAGLVDETKLLEIGSQAFIQLGANAKALPQILELARKTYVGFGGDIVENTEKITQAIFTGQTRQLRSLGILVDTDKVYKDYARSIGTVVPLLSEQQKQTALLNAVLEKGNTTFKNISTEAGGTETAFKKLSVATTELFDALSVKTAQQSSGLFASLASGAASMLSSFTAMINRDPIQKMNDRLGELKTQLMSAQKVLDNVQGSYAAAGRGGEAFVQARVREVERLKAEIAKYEQQIGSAVKKQDELKKNATAPSAGGGGAGTSGPSDEEIRRRQELANKILELNNQVRASEVSLAQEEFSRKQNAANLDMLYYQQKLQAQDQYNQQSKQLELFYTQNGIVDDTLRQQGRESLEQAHLNRMLQLQIQYNEQKKQVFYESETLALTTAESFNAVMEGMDQQAKELSVSASKNFKNLGRQMLTSVGQASANAFAAFGQAIAEGDNALEAFGKSLLNSLGQMAIQMGAQFILQGIAYSYAGLANGPPLIAAGAALAAFGGILAASGGAGPRDVSGGGGTAGGGVGNFSEDNNPINDVVAPEDTQPQTPQTAVNLTINGNVLDRRETGLEIAKILEEQFSEQGLVIRGA